MARSKRYVASLAEVRASSVLDMSPLIRDLVTQVFLTPFGAARLLAPDTSRLPNPDCPVCGVVNVSVTVDLSRATLNDVVEDIVKEYLGFGDREFVLSNAVGIMYDYDETENLPKKLSSLGTHVPVVCLLQKLLTHSRRH